MKRSAVILLALATACRDEGATSAPTFAQHVAPLVYASCTPCHRAGGSAPFPLLGYDDTYKRRDQIAEVVGSKLMPPWLLTHGDFVDDLRLREEQIELLLRWIAAGAPRGDAASEPAAPGFPVGWQLREPDLVVTAPREVLVPATGPDLIRNLVIPVGIDAMRFVAAIEIQPGSPAVHHAVLVVDATAESRRLDALDAEPGFPGMALGNGKPPDGHFLGWTPGRRVRPCREGMAWRLLPGNDLVLQLHLSPTGKQERVQPRIGFHFTNVAPTAVTFPLTLFSEAIDLAPGATDVRVRDHFDLPVPVVLHSLYPHAHYLCRSMVATVTPPGGVASDLFRIDRWDFDWQDAYQLKQPLALAAGTRIAFEYTFDNSAANPQNPANPPRRVRSGQESTDEMATLGLQLTTADLDARRRLGEASLRADLAKVGYDGALLLQLASLLRDLQRHDEALQTVARVREREPQNTNALLEHAACLDAAGRSAEAERAYVDCIDREPGQDTARAQLASLFLRSGRAADAIPLYQQVLARSPNSAALHSNLATACMAAGQLALAEPHYQRAVGLDPGFFVAWFNLGRVLAALGRPAEARTALLRADALRPGDARVQEALGLLPR